MRAISLMLTTALVLGSLLRTCSNPFAVSCLSPLLILVDQPDTNQELLGDFGNRPGGQAQYCGNHVESGRPIGQDRKILSLHRPEAQAVDLFQQTGPLEMRHGDGVVSPGSGKRGGSFEAVEVRAVVFPEIAGR